MVWRVSCWIWCNTLSTSLGVCLNVPRVAWQSGIVQFPSLERVAWPDAWSTVRAQRTPDTRLRRTVSFCFFFSLFRTNPWNAEWHCAPGIQSSRPANSIHHWLPNHGVPSSQRAAILKIKDDYIFHGPVQTSPTQPPSQQMHDARKARSEVSDHSTSTTLPLALSDSTTYLHPRMQQYWLWLSPHLWVLLFNLMRDHLSRICMYLVCVLDTSMIECARPESPSKLFK